MESKKKHAAVVNIGTASMIVILIGLSFAVLAALAISSAQNDYRLSKKLAEHTTEYYNASNQAVEQMVDMEELFEAQDSEGITSFSVNINDRQNLEVAITFGENAKDYEITKWQVVNTSDWEGDASLPVLLQENGE